jgi:peptide subunit release factor 1 (eRF1)
LVATTRLNPTEVTPAVVAETARRAQRGRRPAIERDLLAALEEGLGTGQATNGVRETLRALAKGQVRTLLVARGFAATGFRCALSDRLVLAASDGLGEGTPTPVPDLVGEAIADAHRQNATVVTIQDPDTAHLIDGLAALLRFA